jgi:LysM repeat protein
MAWANKIMEPQPQHELTKTRPQLRHTWKKKDDIAGIGKKYGVDPEEILDYNLVEEHEIKAGDELLIPSKHKTKPKSQKITYEALKSPVEMHVNKPGGIRKYAFGNIKKADDITSSGHFPHATKITIVGIAHVPIGEEVLAYYMDGHAFGDYHETGKVAWNIGYVWRELSEGEYVPEDDTPTPTILDEPEEPLTMFDEIPEEPENDVTEEEPTEVDNVIESPDGVLMPLNADYTPEKFLFEEDIEIRELHDRKNPIKLRANDPIWIIGTFRHEGEEFYQPGKTVGDVVASGLLWPIPMDKVLPEDEMFDYSIKRRGLTRQERWYELLMRVSANYTKVVMLIKQKTNQE